jgi:hypothetical protein
MKAFIVLALVAVAAARVMDVDTLRFLSKEKSLLTKDDDLFLKKDLTHRFSIPKKGLLSSFGYDYPTTSYPSTFTFGDDDVFQRRVTILSFEDLISIPLFREYLEIPLFRQFYEQYPVVFRRYVESPLFQQFWTVPTFQQYFRNPVFFYKYIVPQLQMIAQYPYTSEGVYNKYPTTTGYPFEGHQDYYNTNSRFDRRDITVEDFLNKLYRHRDGNTLSPVYPYAYGTNDFTTPSFPFGGRSSSSVYDQYFNNKFVNHKYLLDKIYRTLFVNQPTVGDVTQVRTDVKLAPSHNQVVVEPTTGETKVVFEPTKIVDVKVDQKIIPTTSVPLDVEQDIVVKEALLKRLLVTKRISYELYTVLKTLPLYHVKEIVKRIVSSPVVDVDFDDFTFPTRHHFGVDDVDQVDFTKDSVYRHKINEIISQLYNNDIVGDKYTPVIRDLMKVLGHHNTVRDFLPRIDEIHL